MFNAKLPTENELPTTKQLLRSTAVAMCVALVLLFTVVMPAEYDLDPTGIGGILGLTEMGEIKESLSGEKKAENQAEAATDAAQTTNTIADKPKEEKPAELSHEMSITLKPNEAAEVKLEMKKGTQAQFAWSVDSGAVNYDTHGDPYDAPKGFYHGYGKGLNKKNDEGVLVAAFDGNHGWFWRNRSGATVTVSLKTQGHYLDIKRVL